MPAKARYRVSPERKFDWNLIGYVLLLAAIISHVVFALKYNFTQDDAFISFRYAENFINGNGLVYNTGERVEGYTNFLWTIFLIIGRLAGLEYVNFSKILGLLAGVGTISVLFLLARQISGNRTIPVGAVCLLLALMPSFSYWSIAGLETPAFAFFTLLSVYFYSRKSYLLGPVLVIASLTRPEGGLILLFIVLYETIRTKSINRFILTIFSIYAILLLPYLFFKLLYYGSILPNPFYAKAGFSLEKMGDGLEYTLRYFWHYLGAGVFIVPSLIYFKKKYSKDIWLLLLLVVYTVYIIVVGGDVLKVHRFFVPVMPIAAFLIVDSLDKIFKGRKIVLLMVAVIIIWQKLIPADFVKTYHTAEKRLTILMKKMAGNLESADSTDFSIAASTIGALGYGLSNHKLIDMLGLTDTTIARHPEPQIGGIVTTWKERHYNSAYLLSQEPDYILFSTGSKPSAPAERALFLYSGFLSNYRTITFHFDGIRHDVFKRYFPIVGPLRPDINPEFVNQYYGAIELKVKGDLRSSMNSLSSALSYLPDSVYSLARYYVAENLKLARQHEKSYNMLRELEKEDTLTYEVYKDLFVYEYLAYRNFERADYYRNRIKKLMPWYVPNLDSLVSRWSSR